MMLPERSGGAVDGHGSQPFDAAAECACFDWELAAPGHGGLLAEVVTSLLSDDPVQRAGVHRSMFAFSYAGWFHRPDEVALLLCRLARSRDVTDRAGLVAAVNDVLFGSDWSDEFDIEISLRLCGSVPPVEGKGFRRSPGPTPCVLAVGDELASLLHDVDADVRREAAELFAIVTPAAMTHLDDLWARSEVEPDPFCRGLLFVAIGLNAGVTALERMTRAARTQPEPVAQFCAQLAIVFLDPTETGVLEDLRAVAGPDIDLRPESARGWCQFETAVELIDWLDELSRLG